ncbi:MAG: PaaI family thioesterase [Hyphomonadaceae bacterium]|nr:PaaI family thioesterase [Hyphomonadaceae bacterium]GIK50563.1 MAG: thioesterase [Alphaproteobacteria bacterium]
MTTSQQRVTAALERIPYARFLGLRAELKGDELTLVMPYGEHLIGNPMLPALHGGVVGALMEVTALTQLAIASKSERFPKTIDIGIDYLRSGRPADTFARARVVKIGRRVANVQAEAWQGERHQPIATLHGHFMTPEVEEPNAAPA